MLFKNNEPISIPEKDYKKLLELRNEAGQITFVFSKDQARTNPTKARSEAGPYMTRAQIEEYPPGVAIRLSATVARKGGSDNFVYCENIQYPPAGSGKPPKYIPRIHTMKNTLVVGEDKEELQWFLVFCSPLVDNGEAGIAAKKRDKNIKHYLSISQPLKDSESFLENEALVDKVRGIIREKGTVTELTQMAYMYGIPGADQLEEPILRRKLLEKVVLDNSKPDPYHIYKHFNKKYSELSKGKLGGKEKWETMINELIAKKVIRYDTTAKTWGVNTDDGKAFKSAIIKLSPKQAPAHIESLMEAVKNQKKLQEELTAIHKDSIPQDK